MPRDSVYGAWPASGEIDIVESKGNLPTSRSSDNVNAVRSSLHWGPGQGLDRYWLTTDVIRSEWFRLSVFSPLLLPDRNGSLTPDFATVTRNYFNKRDTVYGLEVSLISPPRHPNSLTLSSFAVGFKRPLHLEGLARSLRAQDHFQQALLVAW